MKGIKYLLIILTFVYIVYLVAQAIKPEKIVISHESLYTNYVYIPAVQKDRGVLTKFYIDVTKGSGLIFISLPPFFQQDSLIGFKLAEIAVCRIFDDCFKYNYYFYSFDVELAEGLSGTAGFALLIYSFFKNKTMNRYPITGYMLPNGVIAQVAGIDKKLEASLRKFNKMVAPVENNEKIIPIYTILDFDKIFFNETIKIEEVKRPDNFTQIMKDIAYEICKGINDTKIVEYLKRGRYYTAASLCFSKKFNEFEVNLTKEEIDKMIEDFEEKVKNYECYTYVCEEIKYQVLERLEIAKKFNDTKKKYWRYITAKGWFKLIDYANRIDRKNTCNLLKEEYKYVSELYGLKETDNCFEMREMLAKVYVSQYKLRSERAFKEIEKLVYYYLNKYGISLVALNYLEYAEDLLKEDKNSAFYYLFLALEYAL